LLPWCSSSWKTSAIRSCRRAAACFWEHDVHCTRSATPGKLLRLCFSTTPLSLGVQLACRLYGAALPPALAMQEEQRQAYMIKPGSILVVPVLLASCYAALPRAHAHPGMPAVLKVEPRPEATNTRATTAYKLKPRGKDRQQGQGGHLWIVPLPRGAGGDAQC
jgi:hypothetical protein